MSFIPRFLLIVPLFLLGISGLHAQDSDYLKHRKVFDLCSFKRQCSGCYTCDDTRYLVKIKNTQDKQIKEIYYKFYSETFNRILEKEAKIEGSKIDVHTTGLLYICVPDGRHWIISKVVYADESSVTFVIHDRFSNFIQEPDECDCND